MAVGALLIVAFRCCITSNAQDAFGYLGWCPMVPGSWDTHPKTNMTGFEHPPFEDVFPIEHGGFSNVMLVFSSWLGSYLFGTFKGISKDSADFFSQAWFKKDPPCQPWWFWTYLKRAKRNGVWISCYFPTHTFLGGTLPKSSMRKTLGAKHELRIHQFQWCVCANKNAASLAEMFDKYGEVQGQ